MSLLSHLYDGQLAEWCVDRLTGWKAATSRVTWETRMREAVGGTVRPDDRVDKRHWMQIEKAFCIRLAALVQAAPPYAALHGLVWAGLVRRTWANKQAALYPTHARLSATDQSSALQMRPTVDGWLDLRADRDNETVAREAVHGDFPAELMLAGLFDRLRDYFAAHAPVGQLGAEKVLARLCSLLASFAYAYRNDKLDEPMFRLFRPGVPTVEDLLSVTDETAIEELVALSRRLDTSGTLAQLRQLAGDPPTGTPLGIAGPVFLGHWTDSELVITGPNGSTLLDVHTAISTNKTTRSRLWVWKLLTSAWLDTNDSYRIRDVGLYFARHGALITWPVQSLADILLDGRNLDSAKSEFRALAERLRVEERPRRSSVSTLEVPYGKLSQTTTAMAQASRHVVRIAVAIINDHGEVLLVQRRDTGEWKIPGGTLEVDEPIFTGVRRRVEEETGVLVQPERLTGVYKDIQLGVVLLVFRARIISGQPAPTQESTAVDWWIPDRVSTQTNEVVAAGVRDALGTSYAAVGLCDGERLLTDDVA